MPFPPINLHSRISSPGKELLRKKKNGTNIVPPQSFLGHKPREEKETEREKLGRKAGQQATRAPTESAGPDMETDSRDSWLRLTEPLGGSCESVPRSSSGESAAHRANRHSSRTSLGKEDGEQEVQFSLSLTPEAVLVIQKRNLEKQMMAKQKCCASADLRHRRVFPSKRAQGSSKSAAPVAKPDRAADISAIVKISLLNEQYKYDDVEYEDEDGDVDETVMRKCKEWLKGVESAAAFGKVDKLSSLPHLKSC
ncbi:proline-rich protein 18 [Brachyhypopomus gauderio]|uniref:proline-rich protein 18 n=1 Tax=Brachyhypopomus gauderio TaxID=698409 RepID=UPI004043843B